MYGSLDLGRTSSLPTVNAPSGGWAIASLVLAVIGCFLVYFLFVVKKENPKQSFWAWLKDFLSFKKMLIETILKIAYLFFAIYITLSSFELIIY